jgi:hypothetical protein
VTHGVPGAELQAVDVLDLDQARVLRRAARLRGSASVLRRRAASRRAANAAALLRHAGRLEHRARELVHSATLVPAAS